jgi:hypothetical protein
MGVDYDQFIFQDRLKSFAVHALPAAHHLHLLRLMRIHDYRAWRRRHFMGVDYDQFIFRDRLK